MFQVTVAIKDLAYRFVLLYSYRALCFFFRDMISVSTLAGAGTLIHMLEFSAMAMVLFVPMYFLRKDSYEEIELKEFKRKENETDLDETTQEQSGESISVGFVHAFTQTDDTDKYDDDVKVLDTRDFGTDPMPVEDKSGKFTANAETMTDLIEKPTNEGDTRSHDTEEAQVTNSLRKLSESPVFSKLSINDKDCISNDSPSQQNNTPAYIPPPPPIPLPPPPPPLHVVSTLKKTPPPKYKICPLTPVTLNPESIFAANEDFLTNGLVKDVEMEFLKQFGIRSTNLQRQDRRDSGFEDDQISKKSVSIIDDRKQYTLDIILRHTKIPLEKLIRGITFIDLSIVTAKTAKELVKFVPSDQECLSLAPYSDTPHLLTPPDRFFLAASGIQNYALRLEVIEFFHSYNDILKESGRSLAYLYDVVDDLLNHSAQFDCFIKEALKLAIHMNKGRAGWSSANSKKIAFKIKDLLRLRDVKPNDYVAGSGENLSSSGGVRYSLTARQKDSSPVRMLEGYKLKWKSLLHFLVYRLSECNPGAAKFYETWRPMNQISVKDIGFRKELSFLKEGIAKAETLLSFVSENDDMDPENKSIVLGRLSGTIKKAKDSLLNFIKSINHIHIGYERVLVKYNELESASVIEAKDVPADEFFNNIYQLVETLKQLNF